MHTSIIEACLSNQLLGLRNLLTPPLLKCLQAFLIRYKFLSFGPINDDSKVTKSKFLWGENFPQFSLYCRWWWHLCVVQNLWLCHSRSGITAFCFNWLPVSYQNFFWSPKPGTEQGARLKRIKRRILQTSEKAGWQTGQSGLLQGVDVGDDGKLGQRARVAMFCEQHGQIWEQRPRLLRTVGNRTLRHMRHTVTVKPGLVLLLLFKRPEAEALGEQFHCCSWVDGGDGLVVCRTRHETARRSQSTMNLHHRAFSHVSHVQGEAASETDHLELRASCWTIKASLGQL